MAIRKSITLFIAIILLLVGMWYLLSSIKGIFKVDVVRHFPFSEENSLAEWKEKIFKGRVLYKVEGRDHERFVLATSKGTASALYYKIKLDMKQRPIISWKWNAEKFPTKNGIEDLKDAKQDDFAARVYIIFPAFFFTKTRSLEYIWTQNVEEGTISASPYSKNLQLYVIESGKREGVEWVYEERDIYEDYLKAFGEEPRYNIGAVAFMTDADSTDTDARAFYDEIKMGYKK